MLPTGVFYPWLIQTHQIGQGARGLKKRQFPVLQVDGLPWLSTTSFYGNADSDSPNTKSSFQIILFSVLDRKSCQGSRGRNWRLSSSTARVPLWPCSQTGHLGLTKERLRSYIFVSFPQASTRRAWYEIGNIYRQRFALPLLRCVRPQWQCVVTTWCHSMLLCWRTFSYKNKLQTCRVPQLRKV